jgi:tRNA U34 5-methylaminomethyl-2-thiouridine-forming methyltransferase MnmC
MIIEEKDIMPQPVITLDGSHTLYLPFLNVHYHSLFGAVQESEHVFLEAGFRYIQSNRQVVNVLEVGFGTGLNALLTLLNRDATEIVYTAVEPFPVDENVVAALNYPEQFTNPETSGLFRSLHTAPWEIKTKISPGFHLLKLNSRIQDIELNSHEYHLIYFDAFAPDVQPDLWTAQLFEGLFRSLKDEGVLVTYSVKGSVKRNLKASGFSLQRLPGPPGKRHILRAIR